MKELTQGYLNNIKPSYLNAGYPIPKWILFSETMLQNGYKVRLYRAQRTVSKYLYISNRNHKVKVRFSNHKPSTQQQRNEDSDFYVGISNGKCMRTGEVIPLVIAALE